MTYNREKWFTCIQTPNRARVEVHAARCALFNSPRWSGPPEIYTLQLLLMRVIQCIEPARQYFISPRGGRRGNNDSLTQVKRLHVIKSIFFTPAPFIWTLYLRAGRPFLASVLIFAIVDYDWYNKAVLLLSEPAFNNRGGSNIHHKTLIIIQLNSSGRQ